MSRYTTQIVDSLTTEWFRDQPLLNVILENCFDQVFIKDLSSTLIYANRNLALHYGLKEVDQILGKSDFDFYTAEHAEAMRQEELDLMQTGEPLLAKLYTETWPKGGETFNLCSKLPLRNSDGKIVGLIGFGRDITKDKRREKLIWQHTNYDALTGLPNRNYFVGCLNSSIHEANTGHRYTLLALDIDRFKSFNDSYGHGCGDAILIHVAECIHNNVSDHDIVARVGSDEFLLLIDNQKNKTNIVDLAIKIRSNIQAPFFYQNQQYDISCCIGAAEFPSDALDATDLLKFTEQALYRAKQLGDNQFVFYSPEMTTASIRRQTLIADLKQAVADDQIEVMFQPIISCDTEQLYSVEALARWQHPYYGQISPDEFIQIAEEIGIIAQLDERVFHKTIEAAQRWQTVIDPLPVFSVNVSARSLNTGENSSSDIINLLSNLNHGKLLKLRLELTEGSLFLPSEKLNDLMGYCSQNQIELALDDFGTGYSALSYLLDFKIDYLKIDKVFIDGLPENSRNLSVCKAIIQMSKSLGIKVIAEGVEQEEQLLALKELGCDYIQGYYFSKPLSSQVMLDRYSA
ncbi:MULTISPECIES: GGDEF domain-containing phosphodiesterase [unclassified Marinobacterium]|uniref:sensor domain-containing protein n=1 Tax=unclassified Marinobacterium TaxID=2644139 RepID=UPI00156A3C63|nr:MULTISPECIES: GGDEF domain-containing phosphodiesterase [unclassified Marinobacterium]NRP57004.1 Cyclic di-GMP phosphodiesterase Gmr [Marinobacterium sp. xm-d-510]NRP97746.1 Cyclic di-GMP phosphodiesterase Gmr [Marinobacterium sp. xm-a-127]